MLPTRTSSSAAPPGDSETGRDVVLEVRDLRTSYELDEGTLRAVDGVSFTIRRGETLGIIGESGCGKSVTARSIMRLIDPPGRITSGQILLEDDAGAWVDIVALREESRELRAIRGRRIAMVFQEPMASLSPVHTIGNQIVETVRLNRESYPARARAIAVAMLDKVGMPEPARLMDAYPHQLSGGLRQRAMIAMALSGNPSLLIADEPTTALDVTVQWQILRLMNTIKDELGMAMLYITHDLGVVAQVADTMAVMYLGKIVEYGRVTDVFANPLHPYTEKLLGSIPKIGRARTGRLEAIRGNVPTPINLPVECGFRARCDHAFARCEEHVPAIKEVEAGHFVRCFLRHDDAEEGRSDGR